MNIQDALKILSDVLGFDCSSFGEVMGNGILQNFFNSEEDAKAMIVRGFAYPISKELPVEYAVEMNNLINLELEGAIG